ncbi:unnamed protein product [Ixodes pacificus]
MSSGIPPQRIRLNLSPCAVAAVGTVAAAAANNKQSQQPIRAALLRQTSPTQRSCAQQASQSPTIVCWPHDGVKLKSRQSPDQRISPETKALSPGSKGELGLTVFLRRRYPASSGVDDTARGGPVFVVKVRSARYDGIEQAVVCPSGRFLPTGLLFLSYCAVVKWRTRSARLDRPAEYPLLLLCL